MNNVTQTLYICIFDNKYSYYLNFIYIIGSHVSISVKYRIAGVIT